GAEAVVPGVEAAPHVVGVEDPGPALVLAAVAGEAGELVPALVAPVEVAVGPGGPDDLGHSVGQLAEAGLALAQRLLQGLAGADLPDDAAHAGGPAPVVGEEAALGLDPVDAAVAGPDHAVLAVVLADRAAGLLQGGLGGRQIVGVDAAAPDLVRGSGDLGLV